MILDELGGPCETLSDDGMNLTAATLRFGAAGYARHWASCTRNLMGPTSVMLTVLPGAAKEEPMPSGSAKQKVLEVIEKLPPDATLEDAIKRLVLLAKTERGLAELDAGRGVDHDEAKRRLLR